MQALLFTLAGIFSLLLSVLSAGHALLNKRDPKSALGWVACCVFIPYGGPLLYILFGINRAHSSARKMRPVEFPGEFNLVTGEAPAYRELPLAMVGNKVVRKVLTPGNALDILINGDAAYPAMLAALQQARSTIYLATYIFGNGNISKQFIAALKEAISRGVDVKIILDNMGEYMSYPPMSRTLRANGIPVRRFNPFTLVPPSLHLNLRNHRKLLVVDGAVAFTGGINIADKNCLDDNGDRGIQDLHFSIRGPLVADLEAAFLNDWDYCGGDHTQREEDKSAAPVEYPEAGDVAARMVLDGPNEDLDKLSDILGGVISTATRRVWIMTPYFLPDAELIGSLQAASLRNVDVKIVLPSKNNIPLVHWATRHLLWQMLNYGIEVYYQAPPFSHSKLLIIDGLYSLVGSANLDPRSLRLNFELSLEVFSTATNAELEAYFMEKLATARPYTAPDRNARSLPVQLRDAAAWLFSPYL